MPINPSWKSDNLPLKNIHLREDGMWQVGWDSTGASDYRVVLYGKELLVTTDLVYVHDSPGWEIYAPFIEVVGHGKLALSELYQSFIQIQWYRYQGIPEFYQVSEWDGAAWQPRFNVNESGHWVYSIQTANLDDEAEHRFQVIAYDLIGEASAPLEFRVFVVRVPTLDPSTIDISFSSPNIVISQV